MTAPVLSLPERGFGLTLPSAVPRVPPNQGLVRADSVASFLTATEVDVLPELTVPLRPRYPDALRRTGVSGWVKVEYVIGRDGRIQSHSVRLLGGTHLAFSVAATQALRQARFTPARRAGHEVAILVQQTIRFRAEER